MSGLLSAVATREGGQAEKGPVGGLLGRRTIELHLIGFIVVFSASGLVPFIDLIFPVYVTIYLWILSNYVFPSNGCMEVFEMSGYFRLSFLLGTIIGIFLPLAYVLGGFARGDGNAVRQCAPHLFLVAAQILTEIFVSDMGIWSPPVRAYLAAIYNARRIFSLLHWVSAQNYDGQMFKDGAWISFGRFLCVANLIYYSANMYFFIIPTYLPKAIEMYNKAAATRARTSGTSNGNSSLGGSEAATGMKLEKKSK